MGWCAAATAQSVQVSHAWVRATVPGQVASGAFMTLTARSSTRLVEVKTPVAGMADLHEMKMEGNVMRMHAVEGGLDLPAGKPVELKPGAYHFMLMDLKGPLRLNTAIPLTLVFQDAKGTKTLLQIKVPVLQAAPTAPAATKPG